MRLLRVVLILGVFGVIAVAQTTSQHGIQLGDIDRKADPCSDFFQYANGGWRAQNPIPASMDRWSRRWQSGELNKEQLKTILDEVSNNKEWPKGTVEQLISDHYGACMDESRINALGIRADRADVAADRRH
jgi:endothelin-converting enzyme/putative endopeptidase